MLMVAAVWDGDDAGFDEPPQAATSRQTLDTSPEAINRMLSPFGDRSWASEKRGGHPGARAVPIGFANGCVYDRLWRPLS